MACIEFQAEAKSKKDAEARRSLPEWTTNGTPNAISSDNGSVSTSLHKAHGARDILCHCIIRGDHFSSTEGCWVSPEQSGMRPRSGASAACNDRHTARDRRRIYGETRVILQS